MANQPVRARSGMSITVMAPLALGAAVLVVAGVLSMLSIAQSHASTNDLADRIVTEIDQRVRDRLLQLTGLAEKISLQNEHLVELGVYDPSDLASWREVMHRQITIFDGLSGITWGDTRGRATWLVDYPDEDALEWVISSDTEPGMIDMFELSEDGKPGENPVRRLAYDPRPRPWYQAGLDAIGSERGAGWSDVYSWVRNDGSGATLGISYARPILDESGELVGVLDTELELQSVSKFLQALEVGETGTAFLVDQAGLLVASGYGEALMDAEQARVPALEAENETTRRAARAAAAQVGVLAQASRPTRFRASQLNGSGAWIGVTPINAGGLHWTLVTIVPESDLTSRVEELRQRAMVAASVLVIAALALGAGLARFAVRPIVSLRDHVRRVGEGDLDRKLHLRSVRELADLSEDINEMTDALVDRAKLRESLELAMEVQQALLPEAPPQMPGIDVAGFSQYCDETGGDYYDFLAVTEAGERRLGIALGDVMGHGIAAALLMASARALLRSRTTYPTGTLSDHLEHVNGQLTLDTGGTRFMTMLLMVVHAEVGTIEWSTAGQQSGLLYDPDTDAFVELEGTGLPLGIVADAEYDEYRREGIAPGSLLLITTDGLFESSNPAGEQYGWDRIQDSLRRHMEADAKTMAKGVYDELIEFCAETPPGDDVTFIVVRFT